MKVGKNMLAIFGSILIALVLLAAFGCGESIKGITDMRYGIDIRGGVEAVFEPTGLENKVTEKDLENAKNVLETRLDNNKITDREVIVDKKNAYIIVRFPWKSEETDFDPETAIAELGEMEELTFRDEDGNVLVEGKHIVSSIAEKDTENQLASGYAVSLNFDAEGSKQFEKATEKMIGKSLGIYMDDTLISNPSVEEKISGGQATINNMETMEEAQELSDKINAGALPFSLKTTNFSTISPSLGNNALHIMIIAGLIAFILVCIFMIAYYKLPGIVACMVLVLQMLLQLLALSIPQYTLTLPGIAGIILSLGMAVDANIIISERITEELGNGILIKKAIENGYKNGFSSVLDGNITTAIVAVILMIFGSGSMLSFGYTLLVGMIVNVFVGVTMSKKVLQSLMVYKALCDKKHFRKYKEKPMKKFYEKHWFYFGITGILFLIGFVGLFVKGVDLDVQFTGGVVLNYSTTTNPDTEDVQAAIEKLTNRPTTVQVTSNNLTNTKSIVVTLAGNGGMTPEMQKKLSDKMQECIKNADIELLETYVVEPYIGAKAMKNAGIAMLLSVIFIILYIWIRFSELSAGITATIALIHDVCIVFFSFIVFGIPLNDAFVAVVLTIIGYSINDTIVLYDRIRDNKGLHKNIKPLELVNQSITQTFTRSVNTSFTTGICVFVILIISVIFNIESITEFSLPMFFGLISGCYSSICIAGTLWTAWKMRNTKKKCNVQKSNS